MPTLILPDVMVIAAESNSTRVFAVNRDAHIIPDIEIRIPFPNDIPPELADVAAKLHGIADRLAPLHEQYQADQRLRRERIERAVAELHDTLRAHFLDPDDNTEVRRVFAAYTSEEIERARPDESDHFQNSESFRTAEHEQFLKTTPTRR